MRSSFLSSLSTSVATELTRHSFAEFVSNQALSILESSAQYSVAVSGGQIAPECLKHLLLKVGPTTFVTVTVTDERYGVAKIHQNGQVIKRIIEESRPTSSTQLLSPSTTTSISESSDDFAKVIARTTQPVLVLFGVGSDGHVASLFSNHPHVEGVEVAIVNGAPGEFPCRITVTMDYLRKIPNRWALIVGREKRELMRNLRPDSSLPVNLIAPTRWFIASDALEPETFRDSFQ